MISNRVAWESNGLVKRNPNIDKGNIIPRSKTNDFPCDKVTVRYLNQRSKVVTVYFHGPMKTKTWGIGNTFKQHSYPDRRLRVTLPFSKNIYGQSGNYAFQGELPDNYKLQEMIEVLDYIRKEVEEMS